MTGINLMTRKGRILTLSINMPVSSLKYIILVFIFLSLLLYIQQIFAIESGISGIDAEQKFPIAYGNTSEQNESGTLIDGLIFYADYNDSPQAIVAAGENRVKNPDTNYKYVDGILGKGVLISEKQLSVAPEYSTASNISEKEGAIAFWFKPEWNADEPIKDKHRRYLISSQDGKKRFYLYAHRHSVEFGYFTKVPTGDWKSGEWHHITLQWNKKFVSIYIDGNQSSNQPVQKNWKNLWNFAPVFTVGGHSKLMRAGGVFDEFAIWNRNLTKSEVLALYTRGLNKQTIIGTPQEHTFFAGDRSKKNAAYRNRLNHLMNGSFEAGNNNWLIINIPFPTSPSHPSFVPTQLNTTAAGISDKQSFHGKQSLRLSIDPAPSMGSSYHNPQQGTALLRSLAFPLNPDKRYNASFRIKVKSGGPVLARLKLDAMRKLDKVPERLKSQLNIQSNDDKWRHISIEGKPYRAHDNLFRMNITLHNNGVTPAEVYIDAIQVIPESATLSGLKYISDTPVEATLKTGRHANIFDAGKAVNLITSFANSTLNSQQDDFTLKIYDLWDDNIFTKEIPVKLDSTGTTSLSNDISVRDNGIYRATLTAGDNDSVLDEITFTVLPRFKQSGHLGVHASHNEHTLKVAKRLGIKWNRLWDNGRATSWVNVQPRNKNEFLWSFSDSVVDSSANNGFELLGVISWPQNTDKRSDWTTHNRPHWIHKAWGSKEQSSKPLRLLPTDLFYDKHFRELWLNYVRSVVSHYREKIKYWELLNEPYNGGSAEWVSDVYKATVPIIKSANPDAIIVGPCTHLVKGWMKELLSEGILNYIDVFSYHGYYLDASQLKQIHDWSRYDGTARDVFDTENSALASSKFIYQSYHGAAFSGYNTPLHSASKTVKDLVTALWEGTDTYFYYWMVNYDAYEKYPSLLDHTGALQSNAVSYAITAWLIDDLPPSNNIISMENIQYYIFNRNPAEKAVAVIWPTGNQSVDLNLLKNDVNTEIYNIMGGRINANELASSSLKYFDMPVFLVSVSLQELENSLTMLRTHPTD